MLGGAAPIVTAHRGYSTAAPENTLPAFQLAIDHHSDRAELDVQMTKDGVVMVTHDTSLRRCTGRNANIYDLTFAQVRELDAGRWFSARYAGTQIPTLEEVLDLCKGKIQLNIEIKPNAATPELEAETVRIIREKGFEKDCVITSQSYETLCKVKELDPEIETGYILALGVGTYYDLPAADFFSVESTFITSGMVQQIHLRGKTVSAWTVNRTEDARALLSLGVDDVITDKPEMVQDLLNEDADLDRNLVLMRDRLKELLGLTDGVLVIRAGKALVRRDEQASGHAGQRLAVLIAEIPALRGVVRVEHTANLRLQCVEIGAGVVQVLLGLAQLGLGDQVHGVGDLLGLPDASDAAADLTCAGHGLTARLRAGTSPARSLQSPRSAGAPRRSAPRPAPAPA